MYLPHLSVTCFPLSSDLLSEALYTEPNPEKDLILKIPFCVELCVCVHASEFGPDMPLWIILPPVQTS